jgi:methylated-DNA-[protein]-cysteine S-methyltransferase
MFVAATSQGVARLTWRELDEDGFLEWIGEQHPGRPLIQDPEALADVEREVTEYFRGERVEFDMDVDLGVLSEFERGVLEELTEAIRFGQVIPYSELAKRIGKPKAARAVGNAVGANPVPIIVPCHRVVRLDGSLGGYGGGVEPHKTGPQDSYETLWPVYTSNYVERGVGRTRKVRERDDEEEEEQEGGPNHRYEKSGLCGAELDG